MPHFLRDERLENLTITEGRLKQLEEVFRVRLESVPEHSEGNEPNAVISYVIRFDNKGYRVFSLDDLIKYFRQADYVERVIFNIDSKTSLQTTRNLGTFMELRLENKDINASFLQVSSDDGDWVNASFSVTKEVLSKCKNLNRWARSIWSHLIIQIGGVFVGFFISLWAAVQISTLVSIENAFFITFLFFLLIFSNLWIFLNQGFLRLINSAFPNIRFYRPDRDKLHWLMQALIGGLVCAVGLFLLGLFFRYVGRVLESFFSGGT
jgi:hypothetical protein